MDGISKRGVPFIGVDGMEGASGSFRGIEPLPMTEKIRASVRVAGGETTYLQSTLHWGLSTQECGVFRPVLNFRCSFGGSVSAGEPVYDTEKEHVQFSGL